MQLLEPNYFNKGTFFDKGNQVFDVKAYGAKGDGSTNDSSAINAAIAALPANGGVIYFPSGTYIIDATINVPSYTLIRGAGRRATRLFRPSGSYPLVSFTGSAGNNIDKGGMQDISLEGNNLAGYLLQLHFAQTLFFENCGFDGAADTAIDMMSTQDTYFMQCSLNTNHHATNPVIHIYGSAGWSSNMIWFSQLRVEDFWSPAVKIEQGTGYTGVNNGFFFTECKFESVNVGGDMFVADANTVQLHMNQIFMSATGFKAAFSTPVNAITSNAFQLASYRDIYFNASTAVGNSTLNVQCQYGQCAIDNVFFNGNAVTSTVIFNNYSGATFSLGEIGTDGTAPAISGNPSGFNTIPANTVINGSATAQMIDKGGQVFDVMAYGAVGDGSTNDTTAITAARNALNTAGGGRLFFRPGKNFVVTPGIELSSNTHVLAHGATITLDAAYTVPGTLPGGAAFIGIFRVGTTTGTNQTSNVIIEGGIIQGDAFTTYTNSSPTFNSNNHKKVVYIHSLNTLVNCQFRNFKVINLGSPVTLEKMGGINGTPGRNVHSWNITEEQVWVGVQYYCNGYDYEDCSIHDIDVKFCYDDAVAVVGSNGGTAGSGTAQRIQVYNIRGEKSGQTGAFVKLDASNGILSDINVSNVVGYTSGASEELVGIIGASNSANKKFTMWGLQSSGRWNYGLYAQTVGRHISLDTFKFEALYDIQLQGNATPNGAQSIRISNGLCVSRDASLADNIEGHGIGFSAGTGSQGFQNVRVENVDTYNKGKPINEGTTRTLTDGAMSSVTNPTHLTSATASFTAKDLGYQITVTGAGTAGANLVTTITSIVSTTEVILGASCATTVSGASFTITYVPGGAGTIGTLSNMIYDVDVRNSATADCALSSSPRVVRFRQQGQYISDSQVNATALKVSTAPVSGYVLTSDASGNATWQASTGSGVSKGFVVGMAIALG